jgi:hypothetical protein
MMSNEVEVDSMAELMSSKRVLFAREPELPWLPIREVPGFDDADIPGVHGKFFGDPDSGPWFYLIRHDPGAVVERHTHEGNVIHYLLEGEWKLGNQKAGPGWFHYEKKGLRYGPIVSGPEGSLFLTVYDHRPGFITNRESA